MTKWIIGVVVLVLVAGGAWWYFTKGPSVANQGAAATTATVNPATDTSDAALVQDSAAIDAQMQQLNTQQ